MSVDILWLKCRERSSDVAMGPKAGSAHKDARAEAGASFVSAEAEAKYGIWAARVEEEEDLLEEDQMLFRTRGLRPERQDVVERNNVRLAAVAMLLHFTDDIQTHDVLMALTNIWRRRDEWEASLGDVRQPASSSSSIAGAGEPEQERVCKSGLCGSRVTMFVSFQRVLHSWHDVENVVVLQAL